KFRIPYRIIKKVTFSNVRKEEMRDIPHCARLQYRLMLNDAILKATVNFTRGTINVVYNPSSAQNLREKISQEEIIAFLAKEGVHIDRGSVSERDYDYVKEFYSYAFNPPRIREHPPYSYTMEQWRRMKPEWDKKQEDYDKKKRDEFKAWQQQYEREVILGMKPEAKPTFLEKIFGKKGEGKEKGFWFHGI
ncbi:MAG: hypothetical protein KGH78_01165, partial [Candidatus Micrarchaeota archaeon]|nr:hypothetical protein [Candidatus Micrarchaeota archaeon]